MKAWLSRYRASYLSTLAYMLQTTEYNLRDYLQWHHRTNDFTQVAKRKRLVLTAKSRLVVLLLGTLALSLIGLLVLYLLFIISSIDGLIGGSEARLILLNSSVLVLAMLLLMPWVVAYGITVPLWLGETIIQKPVEWLMAASAKKILQDHPATKIAIAGSYGKTTIKEILASVLGQSQKVAATIGNQNTPIGISRFVKQLKGNEEVLIFEFGEYRPGDVKDFSELAQPQVGIITGVNEAHLTQFKDLETSASNIFGLADYLKDGRVYVNAENTLAEKQARSKHILYSRKVVGSWKISQAKTGLNGTSFIAKKGKKTVKAKSHLLGLHQIGPLAVAIDIADRLGMSAQDIERGIAKTKPFEHRLQPRPSADGVLVIDDTYNGSPDGVTADLEFLKRLPAKRKIYITPGLVEMGERAEAVHTKIGRQLAKVVDSVVLIRNSVTPFIEQGLESANFKGQIMWFDDALLCYNSIPSFTRSGDVVLLQNDWPDQYV